MESHHIRKGSITITTASLKRGGYISLISTEKRLQTRAPKTDEKLQPESHDPILKDIGIN